MKSVALETLVHSLVQLISHRQARKHNYRQQNQINVGSLFCDNGKKKCLGLFYIMLCASKMSQNTVIMQQLHKGKCFTCANEGKICFPFYSANKSNHAIMLCHYIRWYWYIGMEISEFISALIWLYIGLKSNELHQIVQTVLWLYVRSCSV